MQEDPQELGEPFTPETGDVGGIEPPYAPVRAGSSTRSFAYLQQPFVTTPNDLIQFYAGLPTRSNLPLINSFKERAVEEWEGSPEIQRVLTSDEYLRHEFRREGWTVPGLGMIDGNRYYERCFQAILSPWWEQSNIAQRWAQEAMRTPGSVAGQALQVRALFKDIPLALVMQELANEMTPEEIAAMAPVADALSDLGTALVEQEELQQQSDNTPPGSPEHEEAEEALTEKRQEVRERTQTVRQARAAATGRGSGGRGRGGAQRQPATRTPATVYPGVSKFSLPQPGRNGNGGGARPSTTPAQAAAATTAAVVGGITPGGIRPPTQAAATQFEQPSPVAPLEEFPANLEEFLEGMEFEPSLASEYAATPTTGGQVSPAVAFQPSPAGVTTSATPGGSDYGEVAQRITTALDQALPLFETYLDVLQGDNETDREFFLEALRRANPTLATALQSAAETQMTPAGALTAGIAALEARNLAAERARLDRLRNQLIRAVAERAEQIGAAVDASVVTTVESFEQRATAEGVVAPGSEQEFARLSDQLTQNLQRNIRASVFESLGITEE